MHTASTSSRRGWWAPIPAAAVAVGLCELLVADRRSLTEFLGQPSLAQALFLAGITAGTVVLAVALRSSRPFSSILLCVAGGVLPWAAGIAGRALGEGKARALLFAVPAEQREQLFGAALRDAALRSWAGALVSCILFGAVALVLVMRERQRPEGRSQLVASVLATVVAVAALAVAFDSRNPSDISPLAVGAAIFVVALWTLTLAGAAPGSSALASGAAGLSLIAGVAALLAAGGGNYLYAAANRSQFRDVLISAASSAAHTGAIACALCVTAALIAVIVPALHESSRSRALVATIVSVGAVAALLLGAGQSVDARARANVGADGSYRAELLNGPSIFDEAPATDMQAAGAAP